MHVGIFHTRAGSHHAGGKAVFVRQMARALADAHEVTLYTQFDPASEIHDRLTDAGVRLVAVPGQFGDPVDSLLDATAPVGRDPLVPLVRAVTDGIASDIDRRVDVLLTHRFLEDLVLSNAVDVPVAYQYHNVRQVGAGAKLRERFSQASIHLANSSAVAAEVRQKLGRDVDGIVSPGVDTDHFSPDTPGQPLADGQTVLFVGRVVPAKGILELLEALDRLDRQPTLHVVGDGEIDLARERADVLGIGDRVRFEGEVAHEALPAYYASADVFANPTHYEGFGMVNVEAMACGTPVVTTRLPGIEGYARDGTNAVLVEPDATDELADAIDALLADSDRRERLASVARETALEFDWAAQADRLVEICRRNVPLSAP